MFSLLVISLKYNKITHWNLTSYTDIITVALNKHENSTAIVDEDYYNKEKTFCQGKLQKVDFCEFQDPHISVLSHLNLENDQAESLIIKILKIHR